MINVTMQREAISDIYGLLRDAILVSSDQNKINNSTHALCVCSAQRSSATVWLGV